MRVGCYLCSLNCAISALRWTTETATACVGGHELTGAMVWHAAAAAGADCGAQRGSVCVCVCECRRGGAASSSRGRARNTRDRIFDRPRSAPARPMQCNAAPTHLHSTSARRDDDDDDDGRTPRVGPGSSHADHGAKGAPSP